MNRRSIIALAIAIVSVAVGVALATGGEDGAGEDRVVPRFPPPLDPYAPQINPGDFVSVIDNPNLPLRVGSRWTYEGRSGNEHETGIVTVTTETETVMGVRCTVVKDVVLVEGEPAEKTFDWFAQDRYGNVWYFGEASTDYENGEPVGTKGSWRAGVDGALPGIVMLGVPHPGDRYRQEFYEGEAEDMAAVLQVNASIEVPYGSFNEVLVTRDWNPLEKGAVERKYYAPGVGLVYERSASGDEGMELVAYSR